MAKKKIKNDSYAVLFVIIILLVPGILHATLPQPFTFVNQLAGLLPLFLLFWPITVVAVTSMLKVWLLKRKLSLPWKFKTMEKLCLGTLAETIGEFIFFTITMGFFAPVFNDALAYFNATADAPAGVNVILRTAMVIPWYSIIGTISMLILINLLTNLDKQQLRRQYLKTAALLSLILPVLVILILTVRIVFFKVTP